MKSSFRPPAVPLVVNDPYMSVWSMADCLAEDWTRHWTGGIQSMIGLLRIDGIPYGFMGPLKGLNDPAIPLMEQNSVEVLPTRTIYRFTASGVELVLTFMTPALPHDLDILSRPITYIDFQVGSSDGTSHQIELYFDIGADWTVNIPLQSVTWGRHQFGSINTTWIGSTEQDVLGKAGDDVRIDWGYLYTAAFPEHGSGSNLNWGMQARQHFLASGSLPNVDQAEMPQPAGQWDSTINASWCFNFGMITEETQNRQLVIAYDDRFSVEYMHRKLQPYWRRNGTDIAKLMHSAVSEYESIKAQCEAFDQEIVNDLVQVGGEPYARLASLSFRQCIAAHKLVVDIDGSPLFFSKENFSNGCMGTVDVTYPSSPFFLLFNPTLLEAQLTPVLHYAESPRWKFPFAPHDLGRYPLANGQVYGGGESSDIDQMPIEECGNMLLMVSAVCKAQADLSFAIRHWDVLNQWASYLSDHGLDPENQLCTDDFAGHLAHNANLSLKAILAIGAFAQLCQQRELSEAAQFFRTQAEDMAQQWLSLADDGDHFRLTFDQPDTWSQKYNLVWDRILELSLFPDAVAEKEITFYKRKQNRYGLPLDNRSTYTKLDWIVWTASLSGNSDDFRGFVHPLYEWLHETESRVPMTDWYFTDNGLQVRGMQARSVVGGVFIPLLFETKIWQKWLTYRH